MTDDDYIDQINYQGNIFVEERGRKALKLSYRSRNYIKKLVNKIKSSNEKHLEKTEIDYQISIIRDKTPFYFVLPNGRMVLSSGIIKRYIDNEALLGVILTRMVFIASNGVYLKNVTVPRGVLSTLEMMKIVDLPLKVKAEINKWTYQMMNRAGFDGFAVLNWIQIQNKNILDFSMMYKDLNLISREEFEFKNYLATGGKFDQVEKTKNSSSDFYKLKKELSRNATIVPIRRTSY